MSVTALVGAQFGSEGKGAVAARIADDFDIHVRTGGPNAGHTYYINDLSALDEAYLSGAPAEILQEGIVGEQIGRERIKVVARQIPCGACNPDATLIIGPGGMIDLTLLLREAAQLDSLGLNVTERLMVDRRALVVDPVRHHQGEGGVTGAAHRLIGSTGEGVGLARMAHLNRKALLHHDLAWTNVDHAGDSLIEETLDSHGIQVTDTVEYLDDMLTNREVRVLLEGTQGSGLSSVTGPWPFCTSADTNAGQLLVDAGISPRRLTNVILVARTYPIRVAGNSGPLANEIGWEMLGVEPETTTVTKKVRRVAEFDRDQFEKAIMLNGPNPWVFFTFLDYIDPSIANVTSWSDLTTEAMLWMNDLAHEFDFSLMGAGTGPDSVAMSPFSPWH